MADAEAPRPLVAAWLRCARVGLVAGVLCACACSPARPAPTLAATALPVPLPATALVPQMAALGACLSAASWLEPRAAGQGYRLRAVLRREGRWGQPFTVDDHADVAMFSADLPGLARLPGGGLLAYWERFERSAGDPYATRIQLARSVDDGRTWRPLPAPHADATVGQHSFTAAFELPDGLGLVWLDAQRQQFVPAARGRKRAWLGAIGLRYALLDGDGRVRSDGFVDPITCECCPTSAALSARGPIVVYRDRASPAQRAEDVRDDGGSVRDVHVARLEGDAWTAPRRVHADEWVMAGCPDNGPALDARGDRVAVAWWTGAGAQPHVSLAFSSDSGQTFSAPIPISAGPAGGQVTVALERDGRAAVVGWLERGQAWARRVEVGGALGEPLALGPAPLRARLPRWIADGDGVLALWSEKRDDGTAVRLTRLSAQP